MAWLKIYEWEEKTYPEFQEIKLARSDVQKYLKKFSRHFKISEPRLILGIKRSVGSYYAVNRSISLPNDISFGLVIHEFAHHLTAELYGPRERHGKKFKRSLKRTYTFAKRYIKNG